MVITNVYHNQQFNVWDRVSVEDVSSLFEFRYTSSIKSFFNTQFIDIPVCFKKSKSTYSQTFEIPLLKFMNILMRSGGRGLVLKLITSTVSTLFHQLQNNRYLTHQATVLFSIIYDTTLVYNKGLVNGGLVNTQGLNLQYLNRLSQMGITFNRRSTITHLLFDELKKYTPLFNFYVRKVDKNVRKNSRGKSGKYMIIWKYVPVYKRFYVTLRWLLKDLKFQKSLTFANRIIKVLELFLTNPHLSFLVRIRKFVHSFVFYNFRKSLLKNLNSVS